MYLDTIICPHCGYKQTDPYELDDGENRCGFCYQPFRLVRIYTVEYSTYRVDAE
jgi:hypothetical protein